MEEQEGQEWELMYPGGSRKAYEAMPARAAVVKRSLHWMAAVVVMLFSECVEEVEEGEAEEVGEGGKVKGAVMGAWGEAAGEGVVGKWAAKGAQEEEAGTPGRPTRK